MTKWLLCLCLVEACSFGDNLAPPGHDAPAAPDACTTCETPDAPVTVTPDAPTEPIDAPAAAVCTLVPQSGCSGATPACDLTTADDGTVACRDVTKQGVSNDHCPLDTDCKAGYTCVNDGVAADIPWCARLCVHDADCTGVGSRCVDPLDNGSGMPLDIDVCSNSCDLVAQTRCASGMGCIGEIATGGDYTDCIYMGTTAVGDACAHTDECTPGAACITSGTTSTCAEYCEVGDDATCDEDETCVGFTTPLEIGGVTFGVCQ